jgi:LmbE family N-acetylglucosaminyl deacetylase
VRPIVGQGTGEDAWRPWTAMAEWPLLPLDPPGPPLVVAPHPDDEILGVARAAKAAAIAAFRSQIAPLGPAEADAAILPPYVLARFARPFEVVFA